MKNYNHFIIICVLACLSSCGEKQKKENVKPRDLTYTRSCEIVGRDTINRIDGRNFKQGLWLIRKRYGDIVIEKGIYKDNQKQGYWIRHTKTGIFMDSVLYKNDMAIF